MQGFVTVLHLSDLHFGNPTRYGRLNMVRLAETFSKSVKAVLRRRNRTLAVDLIVVTGDITETGKPAEFSAALKFFRALANHLGVKPSRFVFVPGNHDISWEKSQIAALELALVGEESNDARLRRGMDSMKFDCYEEFCKEFRGPDEFDPACTTRALANGAYLHDFPDLEISVAGLNSCEKESHRREDHVGSLSEEQAKSVAKAWSDEEYHAWFRVVAVHHNPAATTYRNARDLTKALEDDTTISPDVIPRYAADLVGLEGREYLESLVRQIPVQLVLHGHHHEQACHIWESGGDGIALVLSTGRSPVVRDEALCQGLPSCQPIVLDRTSDPPQVGVYPLVHDKDYRLHGEVAEGGFVAAPAHPDGFRKTLSVNHRKAVDGAGLASTIPVGRGGRAESAVPIVPTPSIPETLLEQLHAVLAGKPAATAGRAPCPGDDTGVPEGPRRCVSSPETVEACRATLKVIACLISEIERSMGS